MKIRLLHLMIAVTMGILSALAQMQGGGSSRNMEQMNNGHVYGKVVDSKTNKGLGYSTVQVVVNKIDTATKQLKNIIVGTVIAENNGDFSIDKLPVQGKLQIRITSIGYNAYEAPLSFEIKRPVADGGQQRQQAVSMADKDLGNIKLERVDATLATVTVTTTKQFFEMGIDRKVFNVDKNIISGGQTATEVMKQIPSVNVDIDGNVTVRNSTPQLFVDGRPTTLTMEQIPADIIDKVELITNPSAKYDASGGSAGILNIVLKKNKKTGYNGNFRAGINSYGKVNLGGDFNYRENKINFFTSGNYNQRKSLSTSITSRDLLIDDPYHIFQSSDGKNTGEYKYFRSGIDYLIDNRNTLTVSGSYTKGKFKGSQPQYIDSSLHGVIQNYSEISSLSDNTFANYGGQLSFKHNFIKEGHNISADINYSDVTSSGGNATETRTFLPNDTPFGFPLLQISDNNGYTKNLVTQIDYEEKLNDNAKIEAGLRGAVRNFKNTGNQYHFEGTEKIYDSIASSKYKFNDQVYAAYTTYSAKLNDKWTYQLGLRAERSNYTGTLLGGGVNSSDTSFKINYAVSLFPSIFLTHKITDNQDLQINYSRKVNRPNFFQLNPTIDISDRANPSRGNPRLEPEFTNSFEFSYNNAYKKNANFLATAYFKYANNLITRYLDREANPLQGVLPGDSVNMSTYINANNSITYGIELTNKFVLMNFWDMTLNGNLFNSRINSSNVPNSTSSINQQVSWFVKWNNNFKLPKNYSIQFSGDYQARTILPQGGGGRGGRGGGGMYGGGGNFGTTQGYINPRYSFDLAVKKEWTWKGGTGASVSLSMSDIFKTQVNSTYSESPYLIQTQERRRDAQILKLNISYRFGKYDASLFKRKNNKTEQGEGTDMMSGM